MSGEQGKLSEIPQTASWPAPESVHLKLRRQEIEFKKSVVDGVPCLTIRIPIDSVGAALLAEMLLGDIPTPPARPRAG